MKTEGLAGGCPPTFKSAGQYRNSTESHKAFLSGRTAASSIYDYAMAHVISSVAAYAEREYTFDSRLFYTKSMHEHNFA